MSPEQARGEKVDKRTDIYSFAIMLYEMLAGEVPFQSDTTFGMLMKHINDPPPPIKGISKDLQALLDRALAKDPSLRYETAGDLANEFMALFNGQTISPGTLHIAEMARKAAEASKKNQAGEAAGSGRTWRRVIIEFAVVLGLGIFILSFFFNPQSPTAGGTPTPRDPNIPVGRLHFSDSGAIMAGFSLSLSRISPPGEGKHLEGWLISDTGADPQGVGPVRFNAAGVGLLDYSDPGSNNILENFDQIIITEEQGSIETPVVVTEPSETILYSSKYPANTLKYIRELLVSHPDTPDPTPDTPGGEAAIQGLFYYSGQYVDLMINGDPDVDPELTSLVEALQNGDEATFRKRTEEVINLIVGDASDLYKDYDNDGTIDQYIGDGYGSLPTGDRLGYFQATATSANSAAEADDSTSNIRTRNQNIQACIQTLEDWTQQLLPLAQQLVDLPMDSPQTETIVQQMSDLGTYILEGRDGDDANNLIDPVLGECGANTIYPEANSMADMDIYEGADRTLLSGK